MYTIFAWDRDIGGDVGLEVGSQVSDANISLSYQNTRCISKDRQFKRAVHGSSSKECQ